jgi:hypothetical protein
VAVEVKSVVDAGFRQMGGEIDRQEYQPCERLTRFWIISVRHGAMIRDLRAQLPGLLVLLEDVGYEGRPLWMLRQKLPSVAEWLDELGVRALHPTPPTAVHPGGFLLLPEPWGKFGDDNLDDVVGFVNSWFASGLPDVRKLHRQLRDADADERHAFLFVGWEYPVPSAVLLRRRWPEGAALLRRRHGPVMGKTWPAFWMQVNRTRLSALKGAR